MVRNLSLSSFFLPLFFFHKCQVLSRQKGIRRLDRKIELKRLPSERVKGRNERKVENGCKQYHNMPKSRLGAKTR